MTSRSSSRPITTLFPIPAAGDQENRVYVSVGHQQMMTDPMKPLGLSLFRLTAGRPMDEAGGRLFVDVTQILASPASRGLPGAPGKSEPLIGDALQTVLDRGDFIPSLPEESSGGPPAGGAPAPIETDPAIVEELIGNSQASVAALKRDIWTKSGSALLDFILADIQELKRILFNPQSHQVIMAGMEATWWLNEQLQAWLGEKNAADTLTQSVPHNVTSEMGLALLDVADVIRPHRRRRGLSAAGRGRGLPGRAAQARGRTGSARRHPGLARHVRHAQRRRDRHHEAALERTPHYARAHHPRPHQELRARAPVSGASSRGGGGRKKEQELLERLRALPEGRKAAETKHD